MTNENINLNKFEEEEGGFDIKIILIWISPVMSRHINNMKNNSTSFNMS